MEMSNQEIRLEQIYEEFKNAFLELAYHDPEQYDKTMISVAQILTEGYKASEMDAVEFTKSLILYLQIHSDLILGKE